MISKKAPFVKERGLDWRWVSLRGRCADAKRENATPDVENIEDSWGGDANGYGIRR
jgi:hypothetical protein